LEVELRPVDAGAAIEEVVALLESQAAAKGIALRSEPCGAEIPRVQADLRRLRQVLTNLVGNAIKFTETGAVVLRCTASNDGTVQIAVADTGIGIAPEMLPMIFGEFYQVEGNLTRSYGGSGLGLPIAQRLARLMGGDVLVQSALGQGSTFTLVLPAAAEGSEVRTEDVLLHELRMEAHENAAHTATATPAVVVAFGEREDTLHALGSKVHPNVRIVGTTDASQVPELARRENASLVVLDLMMPVLDGFGVLATMRADPLLAGVPVVVLTAKSLTEAERRFLARTAVKVLQKGEHRLSDVTTLVLRAALGARVVGAGTT
jgi:CheY-like chemotaxis protein/anti-sigma regulatory factor (Ser/Thr protein kinase)